MVFNRYIVASLLSHLLFVAFLGLTSFNVDRLSSVFDVDIAGPVEEPKDAPARTFKPPVIPHTPPVKEIIKKLPHVKAKPKTLYGEGNGSLPNAPLTPLNRGEFSPTPEKGDDGGLSDKKDAPSIVPPSALFDKKIIEKFALKEPLPDKGLSFDTSEFKNRGYMRMLKEKIESIWQYPKEAARLGLSGDLYIKFTIKKDGKLGGYELLRTSGYKDLDDAAIKALKDAEPFWPLPADWKEDALEIKGYFLYIYGNAYVM